MFILLVAFEACSGTQMANSPLHQWILSRPAEVIKYLTGMVACRMEDAWHVLKNYYGEPMDVKTYNKSDKVRLVSANKYTIDHGKQKTVYADKPGQWFWVKCAGHEWQVPDRGESQIPLVCHFLCYPVLSSPSPFVNDLHPEAGVERAPIRQVGNDNY
jgi:hypothetical protein